MKFSFDRMVFAYSLLISVGFYGDMWARIVAKDYSTAAILLAAATFFWFYPLSNWAGLTRLLSDPMLDTD